MPSTRLFRSGNSQAVRLPKDIAYAEDDLEMEIVRSGEVVTMYPKRKRTMAEFLAALAALPKPTEVEQRDTSEIPEPRGLTD